MNGSFKSSFSDFSTVHVQMARPSILKSHKHSKMIETHFDRLFSIMTDSKIIAGSQSKVWNLIFVVSVLLPIYCHIGWGMPYLCIIVEEGVTLSGAIT